MKISKKALIAMIAVSIAATALPAAAMANNLSNTLTSSAGSAANSAEPQTGAQTAVSTAAPETGAQAAASAPAVQAEPSPESMFITEDEGDNVVITGFNIPDGQTADVVIPNTIGGKTVERLKNFNGSGFDCMPGADKVTSLDTSLCTGLAIDWYAFDSCTALKSVDLSGCDSVGNDAFS